MENLRGLSCNVYRAVDFPDCTADGITGKVKCILLVDDSIRAPFKVAENEIYLVLVRRQFPLSGKGEYIHAEPRMNGKNINGLDYGMFGGNFIYTSDSRFPSNYPIPVHDRFENQETYNALSR